MHMFLPLIILGVLGGVFGLLLAFASKKFGVKEDERVEKISELLPGANCGACGYPGCSGYARAIVSGEASIGLCTGCNQEKLNQIAAIMGTEASAQEKKVAFVNCLGTPDRAEKRFKYYGVNSCLEASVIPGGGDKECRFGCLGMGSCVDVCKFDGIHIVNGVAVVDNEHCVGCGACVKTCPRHVISLIPVSAKVTVNCINTGRGLDVKNICKVGCIGCTMCARNCPEKAITMEANLPKVDHSLCTGCGTCAQKCPVHAIVLRNGVAVLNDD